jgi:hypothetical protein
MLHVRPRPGTNYMVAISAGGGDHGEDRASASRRKRTPSRYRSGRATRSRSTYRTRDPGLWDLARRTAATAAELVELENPFVAECWLSSLVSIWEEAYLVDDDPEKVIGLSVVDAAAAEGTPRALACSAA